MKYNYNATYFLISIPNICHLPDEKLGMEVAFVGYSNSGKSSVINALTCKKKLSKTSKIPGCTKFINLFEVRPGIRLIDFPGYGYAKGIKNENYWYDVICKYLKKRENLKGLMLITDIRYPIKNLDQKMIKSALTANIPVFIILNKSDKISRNALQITLQKVTQKTQTISAMCIQFEPVSALKKHGIGSLKKILNNCLK